jgi:periplasmic protein TonB
MDAALLHESAYGAERQRERARRRDAANVRAVTTIEPAREASPRAPASRAMTALSVSASVAIHVAVAVFAFVWRPAEPSRALSYEAPVHVRILEPPQPLTAPPIAAPEQPVVPPPKAPVVRKPIDTKEPVPPPDPIDVTPPPTADPPKEPPRRIVGIDMESTTVGGDGPAFAVGNTRMGETSRVAQDPTAVEALAPTFTPPRRTRPVEPKYPPQLRAAGVEGDVGLHVEIDADGHVLHVSVSTPSDHDEFDRAAEAAAAASTYEPAKVNGVAVAHAIDFTVRFRLHP